ncbi:MAG: tRNA (adenosine(37)-N6)-threonylcarbamoyltransferase complex dimerization subunit type 1 TsaB [Alphaproteobacteria bacterium]|nr:tRNA (adenosine(37)-N6)-threonylcarbamoyltransferase complex dimerization subunit type 1 TsaB [Alphaproteobacteria bacterium]
MKVLAIDTAGWNSSVALWEDGQELAFQEQNAELDQASRLPQLVKQVVGQHPIDQLIVNSGPGSFTGIRIGLAFAKGLAMGLSLPIKGIDGFTALYVSLECPPNILILIESRRQDIFGKRFQNGTPHPPQSFTREEVEKIILSPTPPLLAGRGASSFLSNLSYKEVIPPWKGAQALAYTFFKDPTIATEALPFYAREADVTYKPCLSNL